MSAVAIFPVTSISVGYSGDLIDALIVKCPKLADWLDTPIPVLPQRDCSDMELNSLPHSEVVAGWLCQSLGMLLTYQEALLSAWGFTPAETCQVLGRGDALCMDTIIDRVMHIVRISIAIEVLMAPRDHGFAWINFARANWNGKSPKHWMLDGLLSDTERKLMEQLHNER